jgi:hypothetical protein
MNDLNFYQRNSGWIHTLSGLIAGVLVTEGTRFTYKKVTKKKSNGGKKAGDKKTNGKKKTASRK